MSHMQHTGFSALLCQGACSSAPCPAKVTGCCIALYSRAGRQELLRSAAAVRALSTRIRGRPRGLWLLFTGAGLAAVVLWGVAGRAGVLDEVVFDAVTGRLTMGRQRPGMLLTWLLLRLPAAVRFLCFPDKCTRFSTYSHAQGCLGTACLCTRCRAPVCVEKGNFYFTKNIIAWEIVRWYCTCTEKETMYLVN